ncbi:MAG: pyridoxal phosphate-dependent aminotransferase [Leptospirales bacterium]
MSDVEKYLSSSVQRIDTSEIRKLFDLAEKIKDPVNLSIGQPDFPVPQAVKDAFAKAVYDDKNAYTMTQGILPLREAICAKWQEENGFSVSPENTIVSAGVASLLYLLYEALLNPGEEIILTDPYFVIYDTLAKLRGVKVTFIPENFTEDDLNVLRKSGVNPKAIIFANPSNPTGLVLSKEQLQLLANYAEEKDALLISDEIYEAFDYDKTFTSCAPIAPDRTITLGGFSKSHAMTGMRVGYMGVASNLRPILSKVAALQQYSIVCSPQPAQWAALTALQTSIEGEISMMKKRRNLVQDILGDRVSYAHPGGAFYVFPEIPIDCVEFSKRAIERELLVVPGYIFSNKRNTIRISYAQPEEKIKKGLKIFLEIVEECNSEI